MKPKCINCKILFERSEPDLKRGRNKFCSQLCYQQYRKKKNDERLLRIQQSKQKQCQFCKKTKSVNDFFRSSKTKDGYGSYCKKCKLNINSKSWNKHKEKHSLQRTDSHLRLTYGISIEQYNRLLESQNGKCAICGNFPKEKKLCVDHDHKTGKIRGLLCELCNRGIGSLKHNILYLSVAIKYLENNKNWY